ncbi:2Fe-2S iron-sulfur cluster-binding protein [Streptomyces sp. TRM76323]|uniref:2Fe-2S iron-sulfur cluster-binding protein n=1 Tax=Streptomyces tamarix TaxID=3078565 RepID=A0ABU3QET6_9ACTN|nr:2Fe-2S iron-sulfur cluster-binding protein [Streptomyces tamarix]MDT9681293.1 2Fe-2S iron-sulfur cluster-binding protein [Streptomyces tamarix]
MTTDENGNEERARSGGWQPTPQGEYDGDATAFVHLPPDMGLDGIPLEAPGHGYVPPHIADPHATAQWNFPPAPDAEHPPAPGPADLTGQWTIPVAQGDLPEESGEYQVGARQFGTAPGYAPEYGGGPEQGYAPERTPTHGSPVHGSPVHEMPAHGTPAHGTPVHGSPVHEMPAHGTPVHESPVQGTPAHGTPVHGTPVHEVPAHGTPAHGTPVHETPAHGTPVHGTPVHETPAPGVPAHGPGHAPASGHAPAPVHEAAVSAPAHAPTPGTTAPAPGHTAGVPAWADGSAPATLPGGAPAPWAVAPQPQPQAGPEAQAPYEPSAVPEARNDGRRADVPAEAAPAPAGEAGDDTEDGLANGTAADDVPADTTGTPATGTPATSATGTSATASASAPDASPAPDGHTPPAVPVVPADTAGTEPGRTAADQAVPGQTAAEQAADHQATAPTAAGQATHQAADHPTPHQAVGHTAAHQAADDTDPHRAAADQAADHTATHQATDHQAADHAATHQAADDTAAAAPPAAEGTGSDEHPHISYVLRVNGADRPVTDAWIGESLLYVLRERLGLAGAKDGCSQGECGACNVQVDGRLVASCLVPAATAAGSEVRTVEGLAVNGEPSDVQRALTRCGAVQCGFCIPGMAMTVHDLLEGNHAPSDVEARQALSGNLCRCTGYQGALRAVREVVAERTAGKRGAAGGGAADGQNSEVRIPHQVPHPHDGGTA